jgi:uncharacterized protein YecT (DUF1311 family)
MQIPNYLSPILATLLTCSSFVLPTKTIANPIIYIANVNCNNAQTQLEINKCAQLSYQNADKTLNQVYQKLLPKLSSPRRQKLITAQQAWIKFRDTNCEFERSGYEGGTIAPTIYLSCLEKLTKQRTQQLQSYLQPNR